MWGSWIGMVISWYLLNLFFTFGLCDSCDTLLEKIINPFKSLIYIGTYNITFDEIIVAIIFPIILGFIFGWGIHSLIRKLRS